MFSRYLFKFLCWIFGHVEKTAWQERLTRLIDKRLISNLWRHSLVSKQLQYTYFLVSYEVCIHQFVFTSPGSQFVLTGPGPQFVFTTSGPCVYRPWRKLCICRSWSLNRIYQPLPRLWSPICIYQSRSIFY